MINDDFCLFDGCILLCYENVFLILEVIFDFLWVIVDIFDMVGLDIDCICQLCNVCRCFQDIYYVEWEVCCVKFIELFKYLYFFDFVWDIMYQYGILQLYLFQWDYIVGMMQFDLFYVYMVDEYMYCLVKYVNYYFFDCNVEFLCCGWIVKNLDKLELLYIVVIFYDIVKG